MWGCPAWLEPKLSAPKVPLVMERGAQCPGPVLSTWFGQIEGSKILHQKENLFQINLLFSSRQCEFIPLWGHKTSKAKPLIFSVNCKEKHSRPMKALLGLKPSRSCPFISSHLKNVCRVVLKQSKLAHSPVPLERYSYLVYFCLCMCVFVFALV